MFQGFDVPKLTITNYHHCTVRILISITSSKYLFNWNGKSNEVIYNVSLVESNPDNFSDECWYLYSPVYLMYYSFPSIPFKIIGFALTKSVYLRHLVFHPSLRDNVSPDPVHLHRSCSPHSCPFSARATTLELAQLLEGRHGGYWLLMGESALLISLVCGVILEFYVYIPWEDKF